LTDQHYRDPFKQFSVLNLVKTILVGLTGSLPPQLLDSFLQATKTTWRVIRTPSNRRELRYEIKRVPNQQLVATIVEDLSANVSGYSPEDRAMVFCRTHNDTEVLARAFGVHAYTSKTATTNAETMRRWIDGNQKIMVCTSILGCGLDYPSVRDVVHYGVAYSMLDQHQQESRGGRDGNVCRATTYAPLGKKFAPAKDTEDFGQTELCAWLEQDSGCLRAIPSKYLDGCSVQCVILPGCAPCAHCADETVWSTPALPTLTSSSPHATFFGATETSSTIDVDL
jgi:superfamily II DNA helicase RecQ